MSLCCYFMVKVLASMPADPRSLRMLRLRQCLCFTILLLGYSLSVSAEFLERIPKPQYTTNVVGAIPNIVIIGTAKGGTTDLYEQLADKDINSEPGRQEPPVFRGPFKEAGFLGMSDDTEPAQISGRLSDYLRRLGHPCANHTQLDKVKRCLRADSSQHITLDATPTYMFLPTAPLQLAALSPSSKIVVMLRDPVERAEILFRHYIVDQGRWKDKSLDVLVDNFFAFINENPVISDGLARMSECTNISQLADGWRELKAAGFLDTLELQLFAGGLYRYALALWRQHYFKAGRYIVIDSHEYYRNRVFVMEQVVSFLYGRPLTSLERTLASKESFWRKGPPAISRAGNDWKPSPTHKAKLQAFYRTHVLKGLGPMLVEMGQQGAWIVGFQDVPWTRYRSYTSYRLAA